MPTATHDNLLRALRRRHQTEALEILAEMVDQLPLAQLDLIRWAKSHHPGGFVSTTRQWVVQECAYHIAEERFEYAICLVERYGGYCAPRRGKTPGLRGRQLYTPNAYGKVQARLDKLPIETEENPI